METLEQQGRRPLVWRGLALLLGGFVGLCTLFSLVITTVQAWQEHAQARWPEATARVERCVVDQSSTGRRNRYYIDCRLTYQAGSEDAAARVYSRQVVAPEAVLWGLQRVLVGDLQEWVDKHPPGSGILVRYDPANHRKVIADLPLSGPHTPDNVRLTGYAAIISLALLAIGMVGRRGLG